jgi:hypothetical protein
MADTVARQASDLNRAKGTHQRAGRTAHPGDARHPRVAIGQTGVAAPGIKHVVDGPADTHHATRQPGQFAGGLQGICHGSATVHAPGLHGAAQPHS